MSLFYLLFGYCRLYANAENCLALLNLCMERGYTYANFHTDSEGGISFDCAVFTAKQILSACRKRGICAAQVKRGGFPYFVWRYRRRMGMLLGLTIGAFLVWASSLFVWDVRIQGNSTMSTEEVRESLDACGFGVGSYIPNFNGNELENRVLLYSDQIAWISVYMDGTVAVVQIRELEAAPTEESKKPANLVAAYDGQIEVVELYRGNCVVSVGSAVRKGELLVSGIYDSNTVGYRYTRASGKVLARVEETVRIEIPLSYEKKVYLPKENGAISLEFFDFSLKILKNSRNYDAPCDIIKKENELKLFGGAALPFGWTVETVYPYHIEQAQRTHEEALELAYKQLEAELEARMKNAQVLDKSIFTTMNESALVLECKVKCIRDIALQVEFDVVE